MDFKIWALMFQLFVNGEWQNKAIEAQTKLECEAGMAVLQYKLIIEGVQGHVWCERVKSMNPEDLVFYEFN